MARRRTYKVNADSWTVLRDILVNPADEFNPDSATLRGRIPTMSDGKYIYQGRLSNSDWNTLRDSTITYVIFSYQTPIAYRRIADWNGNGTVNYEWIVPDARYSVTTSKHQGKVRTALSQISGGI